MTIWGHSEGEGQNPELSECSGRRQNNLSMARPLPGAGRKLQQADRAPAVGRARGGPSSGELTPT